MPNLEDTTSLANATAKLCWLTAPAAVRERLSGYRGGDHEQGQRREEVPEHAADSRDSHATHEAAFLQEAPPRPQP